MYKTTCFLAKKYSVTNQTIQKWIKDGNFNNVKRTKGGHYRIWIDEPIKTILYGRISSSKQKTSIIKQEKLLKSKYQESEFIFDVASGFNQNRRKYRTILELAINKTPVHIVATTSDRITRTGYQLIKWIVKLSGGRIELLEEKDSSEQFDSSILISFVTSFINSYYGKRSAVRRKDNNEQKDKNLSRKQYLMV